jgi:hypothetical protein
LIGVSCEAGSNVGVVAADSVREPTGGTGMLDRDARDGLMSCTLFFLDLVPAEPFLAVFVRAGGLMGDESREARGEGAVELLAVDGFDG